MVEIITEELTLQDYKAADGIGLYMELGTKENLSDIRKWAEEVEQGIVSCTVVYKGQIIACVGITMMLEGVGQLWAIYPPNIGSYHIDPRITKDKIKELMTKHNLRRVQATARADFPAASSYLRYLGLKREGLMEKYEPDETDAYLYAITR